MAYQRHLFITGYPGFLARRLVQKLLSADAQLEITVLVEARCVEKAQSEIEKLREARPADDVGARIRIVSGDVTAMDVGLSGPEFRQIIEQTTEVFHLAAIHELGVQKNQAESVNVLGTKNMLALARTISSLERFTHFSSAYVSGDRVGVILEEELESGQGFRNAYEATKHKAEVLVRRASYDLPVTVIRPSGVVGDSQTGEIDRYGGVYHLGILLATSPTPIPLSGSGRAPLNLVPVDYLIDAVHAIINRPETIGQTFHLCDPNPLSVRGVYELVAQYFGRRVPRYHVSPKLSKVLLRIPGLERLAPKSREAIDYLNQMAFYHCGNTQDALAGTGIRCPRFESYVERLVEFVRSREDAIR